jgi:hypothetical protein
VIGSGFFLCGERGETPAQVHAFLATAWFDRVKAPRTVTRAISIWPASNSWLLVRDDGGVGPGLAFGPDQRGPNMAYQGLTDGIGYSLPGFLGDRLAGRALSFREFSPGRVLLLELEGRELRRARFGTADEVRAWLMELGAPDPAIAPPRGKATTRRYGARLEFGKLPSAAHAEALVQLQAAITAEDARAAWPLVESLAKDGVFDVAVPWIEEARPSPFLVALGKKASRAKELLAAVRELLLLRAIESRGDLVNALAALHKEHPLRRELGRLAVPARALIAARRPAQARALLLLAEHDFRHLDVELALETFRAAKRSTPELVRWLEIGDRYVAWARATKSKGGPVTAQLAAIRRRVIL